MIDIKQDVNVVRTMFLSECKERKIPVQNKAIALWTMAEMLSENPDDDTLRELLFLTLSDEELMITVNGAYNSYEVEESFQNVRESYEKLWKTYREQERLEDAFSDYQALKAVIKFDGIKQVGGDGQSDEDAKIKEEAMAVAWIVCECLKLEPKMQEIMVVYAQNILSVIYEDSFLECCKPLILYLAFSRYEKEILGQKSFDVALKDLFRTVTYPLDTMTKKEKKKYKAWTKLYRKLCKYYKKEGSVDKKLCRYGFFATSNLVDFVINEQIDKCKMHCPPFLYRVLFMDMSCLQADQTQSWEEGALFGMSEDLQEEYYDLTGEDAGEYGDETVDELVYEYLQKHEEILLEMMESLYMDEEKVVEVVHRVFDSCLKDPAGWLEKYKPALLAEVYVVMTAAIDTMVEAKVLPICSL